MTCRCGNPSLSHDTLCARCRYYQTVFNPVRTAFENKREMSLKAIATKRMMKQSSKIIRVE